MSYALVQRRSSFGLVETLPYVPPQTPGGEMSWPSCPGQFVVVDYAGRPAGCASVCDQKFERYTTTDPAQGYVHYCVTPGAPIPPSFNPASPSSPPGGGVPTPGSGSGGGGSAPSRESQPIAEQQPAGMPSTDTAVMVIVAGGALLLLGSIMFGD